MDKLRKSEAHWKIPKRSMSLLQVLEIYGFKLDQRGNILAVYSGGKCSKYVGKIIKRENLEVNYIKGDKIQIEAAIDFRSVLEEIGQGYAEEPSSREIATYLRDSVRDVTNLADRLEKVD